MTEPLEYCPGCEPTMDPVVSLVVTRWCHRHTPDLRGADDEALEFSTRFDTSGNAEIDPDANRAWCRAIHGPQRG